jgi:xylan 1,4-beta-xylosidase
VDRRTMLAAGGAAAFAGTLNLAGQALAAAPLERVPVSIDTRQVTGPLRHVWAESAGSDRAAITLRESWRKDLDRWKNEAGLKRVRFHGILNDDLGVYAPSIMSRGRPAPNFRNLFEVYDGLLEHGVSPYVEVSFMPRQLASGNAVFGFYNGNITPPKDMKAWGDFITLWVRALADRYGINAVRSWPFEIWNEPNLGFFWAGKQEQYFDLYKATVVAIKSVDQAIPVGGPSTSAGAWVGEFCAWATANNAPVDFIATHAYSGGNQTELYGKGVAYSPNQVIPDTVRKARGLIDASKLAGRPLWLSEWSSDSPAMIAHVIKECMPMVRGMSHWTMSGSYEELGVADFILKEGDGGWPTIVQGIARPSFNTYKLLHQLGNQALRSQGPAIASRRANGSVAALVWNLAEAQQAAGIPGAAATRTVKGDAKLLQVRFAGRGAGTPVRVRYVDQERGSPMPAWRAMGSPKLPTPAQMAQLRRAAEIAPPVTMRLDASGGLALQLPPEGVALLELA